MDYLGTIEHDNDLINYQYLKERLAELEKVLSEKGVE